MSSVAQQSDGGALRRVQADGSVLFVGSNIRFRIQVLKPGLILMTVLGASSNAEDTRAELAMFAEMDQELERSGKLQVYCDLRETGRMTASSRDISAKWIKRHQVRLEPSHVLLRSKLVEMAMAVLSMLVGGGMIRTYSKADVFLEALRKAGAKVASLPLIQP